MSKEQQMAHRSIRLGILILITAAFVSVFIAASPGTAKTGPAKAVGKALEAFHPFYEKTLADAGIVGSSFMFVFDNKIIDKDFYGFANKEQNQPVDEHTIFHWASITKTFTGIAVMQLRDRGLLNLDDAVVKYIPELRQCHDPFGDMSEITIRHLMSHSAGFRADTWPWKDKPWQPFEPTRWEQLVAMFPYTEILFKPGTKFSYSNPAIIYLAIIVERLTGDDFEVYVDKNIFRPLEMYESYYDRTPYHLLKNRARSYFRTGDDLVAAPFDVDTGITTSNGGLNAPLTDFVKYLNFLMGCPEKQDVYDGILKRSSLEEMFRPVIGIGDEKAAPPAGEEGRKDFMGLTYFVEDNSGMRFIGHSGSQNGFISHFFYQPERRAAYVVAYNTTSIPKDVSDPSDKRNTRAADQEIKKYLFKSVFSIIPQARANP
jgi:CubicO group peptidase (beta-lactamase class C family)